MRGTPTMWRATEFGERGFCATCGTLLTIRDDFQPETNDVTATALDQPTAVTPGFHIFCRDAIAWVEINDGVPRHAEFVPGLAPGQGRASVEQDSGIMSCAA